jgi:hypothetical protein
MYVSMYVGLYLLWALQGHIFPKAVPVSFLCFDMNFLFALQFDSLTAGVH